MNKKIISISAIIVAIIGISAGVILYNQQTNIQQQEVLKEIKIGHLPIVPSLPVYVAIEKGYFEEVGLKPVVTKFQTSNQLAEAVLNKDVDLGGIIGAPIIFAIEQNTPNNLKIITMNILSTKSPITHFIVNKNSTINSVNDLAGKKIGLFPGSISLISIKMIFKDMLGKEPEGIEYVQMPPTLWLESLSNGKVDAIFSYEPFTTLAVQKGVAKIIYEAPAEKHIMDNLPGGGFVVSRDLIDNNPDFVSKIEYVMEKAIRFIRDNDKEARLIATKYIPLTEEVALDMNMPVWVTKKELTDDIVNRFQQYADMLYEEKALENKVDASIIIYR